MVGFMRVVSGVALLAGCVGVLPGVGSSASQASGEGRALPAASVGGTPALGQVQQPLAAGSLRKATRLEVGQSDLVLPLRNSKVLAGTVTYSDGTRDGAVQWASSDEAILSVDAVTGRATALKEGQATIIASVIGDASVRVQIQVTVRSEGAQDVLVRMGETAVTLVPGQTRQLDAVIQDSNGRQGGNLVWSSSNQLVAVVNATGLVTAVTPGIASVTAASQLDPTRRASVQITVVAP